MFPSLLRFSSNRIGIRGVSSPQLRNFHLSTAFLNSFTKPKVDHMLKERTQQFRDRTTKLKEQTQLQIKKSKETIDNIKKIIPPEIHENVYTIPNILTFTRLISAPVIGYMILHGEVSLALALFTYSCVTDFLDGFIARRWNLKSVVGSIIDPMADKLLMVVCTTTLAMSSSIPMYVASLIIGRDVALVFGAAIIRYISLPAPKTFLRYWDFSIVSVEVHPTLISKINTGLQMLYLGSMMVKPVFMLYLSQHFGADTTQLFLDYIQYLEWTVAATTLWSGLSYAFSRNAVKLIKPPTKN